MKNKIEDLNNHLFAQLEKISDEDLKPEDFRREIERSKQIANLAKCITANHKTAIEAIKLASKEGDNPSQSKSAKMLMIDK